MKNPSRLAELHKTLESTSGETMESLRLLKAFTKLTPAQRSAIVEMVERLAIGKGGLGGTSLS